MVSTVIRDRRRVLRYRNLVVERMAQMKNRVSGLLIETGAHMAGPQVEAIACDKCCPRRPKSLCPQDENSLEVYLPPSKASRIAGIKSLLR
jgi:hypothetical protein